MPRPARLTGEIQSGENLSLRTVTIDPDTATVTDTGVTVRGASSSRNLPGLEYFAGREGQAFVWGGRSSVTGRT